MTWHIVCPYCGSSDVEECPSSQVLDGEKMHLTHRCRECTGEMGVTEPKQEILIMYAEPEVPA